MNVDILGFQKNVKDVVSRVNRLIIFYFLVRWRGYCGHKLGSLFLPEVLRTDLYWRILLIYWKSNRIRSSLMFLLVSSRGSFGCYGTIRMLLILKVKSTQLRLQWRKLKMMHDNGLRFISPRRTMRRLVAEEIVRCRSGKFLVLVF